MAEPPSQLEATARLISARADELYRQALLSGRLSIHSATSPADMEAATHLEEYGLVFRQAFPAGYDLFPTPFEILIPSLLHRLDWLYPPFADLSASARRDLRDSLLQLYQVSRSPSPLPRPPGPAQTIEGAAEIDAFVARALRSASHVCAISAAEWSANLPLLWAVLAQRLKEGMRYRRVVSPFGLAAFGWNVNFRDTTETGVELRVSLAELRSPFYLFTNAHLRSALVFASSPTQPAEPRATYTDLGQLADRLSTIFEDLWHSAVPVAPVLERLRLHRPAYIALASKACGDPASRVASLLFDMGIFAQIAPADQPVLSDLANSGLALVSNFRIGLTPYVPNVLDEIVSAVCNQGGSHATRNA